MKVLITGANGFIGKYLAQQLHANHDIVTFSSSEVDLTDKVQLKNLQKNIPTLQQ